MGSYLRQTTSSLKTAFCIAAVLSAVPGAFCAGSPASSSLTEAVANFNAKNYSGAQKGLSTYLQTNPNDYKAHFYLANSLVKLGRIDDASGEYKKVLTLTPDSKTGIASMEAFNKIADMHSPAQSKSATAFAGTASLPPPPVAPIAPRFNQFLQTQRQGSTASTQSNSQTPFVANNQFGYGRNFSNNAGNGNELIPASVAASGAKVSPTFNSMRSNPFGNRNQYGQPNFGNGPYGGLGPYGNYGSQSQFGNPGFGNSNFGNSGYNNFGRMRHHRNRYQNAFNGNQSGNYQPGNNLNGRYSNFPVNAGRYHMGGYIQNYEITDTPSGNAVPLVAEQKKFEDLAKETTGTRAGVAASQLAKNKSHK